MGAYLRLFASCMPVKGALMHIICDLQRSSYCYIPEDLYEILVVAKTDTVASIRSKYGQEDQVTFDEYMTFLVDHEYAFFTDEPEKFPEIDTSFILPEKINNAIIDADSGSKHDYQAIFEQLDDLGCKSLELRFFNRKHFSSIVDILLLTKYKKFRNIDLYVKYTTDIEKEIEEFKDTIYLGNLGVLYVHSSPQMNLVRDELRFHVVYSDEKIFSANCCGNITNFNVNLNTYLESLSFNTCLNRKISIDVNGEIKNCPSMDRGFGNIATKNLEVALNEDGFKQLWYVKKDEIKVCQDCQFRYICTDCRAFLSDMYAKPFKCNYDPYRHIWQES